MIEPFCTIIRKYFDFDDIKVVMELGSRDLEQSIELSKIYKNAKIYAFECNPDQYKICIDKACMFENIKVFDKAVHDIDGKCDFFIIDIDRQEKQNRGASSLFKTSGNYDKIETLPQVKIEVECTRLDTFCKENKIDCIDLIWMDLQGAELLALKGMDKLIENVKAIHTEVIYQEIYNGQVLFDELDKFLIEKEFVIEYKRDQVKGWFGDAIYINSRYFRS